MTEKPQVLGAGQRRYLPRVAGPSTTHVKGPQRLDLPLVQPQFPQVGHARLGNQVENIVAGAVESHPEGVADFLEDRLRQWVARSH